MADAASLLRGFDLDGKGFKQLLDSQSLVDCTLACDGGTISAHKVVLSACSSYLAKILIDHPVEHPIIILPDLKIEDVKTLVHYMYTGELLRSDSLNSSRLLHTAAILSVNSLNDFRSNGPSETQTRAETVPVNTPTYSLTENRLNTSALVNVDPNSEGASNRSEFQFKCPVCQNTFQTICSFEYHMQRVHNVTSFGCEICNKPFASLRYVLIDHMRRCHGWKAGQKMKSD